MHDNLLGGFIYISEGAGPSEGIGEGALGYAGVKVYYIKLQEAVLMFIWDAIEPFDHSWGVSPLVEVQFVPNVVVDFLKVLFAY